MRQARRSWSVSSNLVYVHSMQGIGTATVPRRDRGPTAAAELAKTLAVFVMDGVVESRDRRSRKMITLWGNLAV